jgi:hypothetical protein
MQCCHTYQHEITCEIEKQFDSASIGLRDFSINISFVVLKVEINIFVALRIETWDQCFFRCVDCYIESW